MQREHTCVCIPLIEQLCKTSTMSLLGEGRKKNSQRALMDLEVHITEQLWIPVTNATVTWAGVLIMHQTIVDICHRYITDRWGVCLTTRQPIVDTCHRCNADRQFDRTKADYCDWKQLMKTSSNSTILRRFTVSIWQDSKFDEWLAFFVSSLDITLAFLL